MNTTGLLLMVCALVFVIGVFGSIKDAVWKRRLIETGAGYYNPTNGKFELRNFYSYTNSFNNK